MSESFLSLCPDDDPGSHKDCANKIENLFEVTVYTDTIREALNLFRGTGHLAPGSTFKLYQCMVCCALVIMVDHGNNKVAQYVINLPKEKF